jgi:hypothetical protein
VLIALKVGSGTSAQRIIEVGAAIANNTLTSRLGGRTCECAQSAVSRRPINAGDRREGSPRSEFSRSDSGLAAEVQLLFRRVVVQVLPEPALDLYHAHPLAFAIVGDLITVDLAEAEIS